MNIFSIIYLRIIYFTCGISIWGAIFKYYFFNCIICMSICNCVLLAVIANTKKYLQSDWLRGVQYWLYLYSVFNICTLLLNNNNNNNSSNNDNNNNNIIKKQHSI